jgi:hypothetical protein
MKKALNVSPKEIGKIRQIEELNSSLSMLIKE